MITKFNMGFCFKCKCDNIHYKIIETAVTHIIEGIPVTYYAELPYCENCGSEIYVPILSERNTDKLLQEYFILKQTRCI